MNIPKDLKYTKDHEWIRKIDDNTAEIGVTDYAQGELGDIVYVEIDTEGEELSSGDVFGSVEAVKTVSDLYLPVDGTISEVNKELDDDPSVVNADPYGKGWMIKVSLSDPSQLDNLLTAEKYEELVS